MVIKSLIDCRDLYSVVVYTLDSDVVIREFKLPSRFPSD